MNFRNKGRPAEKDSIMKHINTITLQGSIEQMRTRIAIEQGAMHQVQLSVARWRGGDAGSKPEHGQEVQAGPGPAMAASQAEWHAAAQCHFLCWLSKGGFAQACLETEVDRPAGPADVAQEARDGKAEGRTEAKAQILPAACHDCDT